MLKRIKRKIKNIIKRLLSFVKGSDGKNIFDDASDKARAKLYGSIRKNRWHDMNFAREDDVDLTADEIKAIDEYWGKYSFAYPEIFYDSFKVFKNRCGYFDVRHCPGAIRKHFFNTYFMNDKYKTAHQNKASYDLIYPGVPKPVTVMRKMETIFFNKDFEPVSFDEAAQQVLDELNAGYDIILKPSGTGGGRKIHFLYAKDDHTKEEVKETILAVKSITSVAQRVLQQSPFMSSFNDSSLNTIRITSLLYKRKVHILGTLIRIGAPGSKVDNYTQGGAVLGVDVKTGICNKWAMTHDLEKVTQLKSGLILDAVELKIPNYDKIVEAVTKMHYLTPYNRLVSWDMALDKDNVPTMIENNFAGSIQLHEAVGGPLLGDMADELLDKYLIEKCKIEFSAKGWMFEEYHDRVEVKGYKGESKEPKVPEKINGKPVVYNIEEGE